MNMHVFRFFMAWMVGLGLLSGCDVMRTPTEAIDPPPLAEQERTPAPSLQTDPNRWLQIVVADPQGMRVPLAVHPPRDAIKTEQLAEVALDWMKIESPRSAALPAGFQGVLPAKMTIEQVRHDANEKKIIIDVAKNFTAYEADKERGMLEAIGWSMAMLPEVDHVELRMEGEKLTHMPVDQTPIHVPLNETIGLNIDSSSMNYVGQASWQYVYEQKQSKNGFVYQVPVYRQLPAVIEVNSLERTGTIDLGEETLNPWELE